MKFHSGKDFSSADVVYSFKRLLDPEDRLGRPRGARVPRSGRHHGAGSPTTVVFTTKKPVVELPVLITNKFTNIVPDGAKRRDAPSA